MQLIEHDVDVWVSYIAEIGGSKLVENFQYQNNENLTIIRTTHMCSAG